MDCSCEPKSLRKARSCGIARMGLHGLSLALAWPWPGLGLALALHCVFEIHCGVAPCRVDAARRWRREA